MLRRPREWVQLSRELWTAGETHESHGNVTQNGAFRPFAPRQPAPPCSGGLTSRRCIELRLSTSERPRKSRHPFTFRHASRNMFPGWPAGPALYPGRTAPADGRPSANFIRVTQDTAQRNCAARRPLSERPCPPRSRRSGLSEALFLETCRKTEPAALCGTSAPSTSCYELTPQADKCSGGSVAP